MPLPPSGTVTFLFTDIEGSTRLWEEQPGEMRSVVAEHDAVVRSAIESNGGYIFATVGDGFAAAFGRAADAVAAAEEAQAGISDLDRIEVRMGINTGEVHERDGDYFGPPVNRAARLMAAGHGGQVLISAVTAELVPGLVLTNLGEHRLRDLGRPMLIWQLGTAPFPPLRTLDELPGNLPVQRTSFIGRAEEVKRLAALVGTERLVTLTGVGGVGKSRLALQVAADVAPSLRDGVWFVSLAALEEGGLAAAAIIEALRVPERRGESPVDTLCVWAKSHEALVVIDNCEHLLAAIAQVIDRVMESSTTVTVLATSQSPLALRGEHVWSVAPLSGASGALHDSVELFVDRARMVRADFDLNADNERSVVEICERLDHVPLAIELAAARVRGMAPVDIARRLDQRFRLLTSSDRLAPGRHRTLDAAVRWSYDLLEEPQRQVFDRLSVFAGPFTIEAAEAVVSGDGVEDWAVLDSILALVDKSLVVADDRAGDSRYRLLETMRQFGQADLAAAGDAHRYRARHGDYYADFVLSRRGQLHGSGDLAAVDAVEHELENIRAALRQAAGDHGSSRYENLFTSLYTLWMGRSRRSEGAAWAGELQQRPDLDPADRIVALGCAAMITQSSDLIIADEMARAADDLWTHTGAVPPLGALSVLSLDAMMRGQAETAIAHCDRLIALSDEEPDLFIRCAALSGCYAVLGICRAFDRLEAVRRDLLVLTAQVDNRHLEAGVMSAFATVAQLTDPDNAGEVLRHAYEINNEIANHQASMSIAMFLALHESRVGDRVAAAPWARRALELAIDQGPSYVAQITSAIIAIVKRQSPTESVVLLGALRADRRRKRQDGTNLEVDAETHYDASLRRQLGDQFDALYEQGLALDETEMIALAFTLLDEVLEADSLGHA